MRNHRLRSKQSEIEVLGPQIASYAINNNEVVNDGGVFKVTYYYPSGIEIGDLLIFITRPGNSGTLSTPSGWTLVKSHSGNGVTYVYSRVADSALSGSFTLDMNETVSAGGIILRVTGNISNTVASSRYGITNLNPPSLTTAFSPSDAYKLFIAVHTHRYTTQNITTLPDGYSGLIQCSGGNACNGSRTTIGVAFKTTQNVTDDPSTFGTSGTCQANQPHGITLAVA